MRLIFLLVMGLWMVQSNIYAQDSVDMRPEDTEWYEPVPAKVTPAETHFLQPPSDAIILFNGNNLDAWESSAGGEAAWIVEGDHFTVKTGTGDIQTKNSFKSVQFYIEWRSPGNLDHKGQDRGNSGIFFQNIYELQVLDAWENPTYVNGMAGSIYKQTPPLVNPAKKPGEWQSYNVSYTAPKFNEDGSLNSPARITVIWNGVVVQNNTEIKGHTPYIGLPEYGAHGAGPIRLQDHNSEVSYRNIWIRELDTEE
ncbi:3-keto-disaccharide hydrolase [Gracilimonas mengyeensis]|uniref:3-keto-alpha-glucoside-1,2-lyase/3-keto-2-hydroxy-glucal hydratase domain-containing protein n=1 Tax=Gracilimonas mengyeensis TaxID=1302730 RepID=A0A521AZS0_9BACT|nr:DUF1080 domain-containing protein [Gracilimonas mengyeensis]SMO40030.1 protein of unknown function [Gracilimonas mengyeensis]